MTWLEYINRYTTDCTNSFLTTPRKALFSGTASQFADSIIQEWRAHGDERVRPCKAISKTVSQFIDSTQKFYSFADLKDIYAKMVNSIDPGIYGNTVESWMYRNERTNLAVSFIVDTCFRNAYIPGDEDGLNIQVIKELANLYENGYIKEVCKMTHEDYLGIRNWVTKNNGSIEVDSNGFTEPTVTVTVNINSFSKLVNKVHEIAPRNGKQLCQDYMSAGDVRKVETYNDRVVKVTFGDGSFTKSVCSENDKFDLDVGITICLMKRMLGKDGNKKYNNAIRRIHKIMEDNLKAKEEEKAQKAKIKEENRKRNERRAEGKKKAIREQIDIQKTAYIEAINSLECCAEKKAGD